MRIILDNAALAAIASVLVISAISLSGAVVLALRPAALHRLLLVLVSFAAGALLGDAFLHLIPEIAEENGFGPPAGLALIGGVLVFFVLEKTLHWHHAHIADEHVVHPVAVTNLVGDALHNLVDGALVAAAFVGSTELGIATAIAVALHEIPQEIGDFAILVHAGMKPRRALALNVASALTALVGALVTLFVAWNASGPVRWLLPVTAGGFVYIAATDLLPELHREPEVGKSLVQLTGLLAGVGIMAALLVLE